MKRNYDEIMANARKAYILKFGIEPTETFITKEGMQMLKKLLSIDNRETDIPCESMQEIFLSGNRVVLGGNGGKILEYILE